MAENTPLYESISNVYNGPALGVPNRDIFGQGVVGANDLLVSAHAAANSIDVAAGVCWVVGDNDVVRQPTYRCFNDAIVNLGISPDPTNPRKVRVMAQVNDADFVGGARNWVLTALHGTPAGSPVDPAEPASAMTLATILVPAAAASSAVYTITDLRARALIGGGQAPLAPGNFSVITTGTVSYTAPPNAAGLKITQVGGGGGSGGVATVAAASGGSVAGGGGGGAEHFLNTNIGTHTVAVGAGGSAGAAGNNAGGVGGNTTFADTASTIVCQANGGSGGVGATASATVPAVINIAAGASPSGIGQAGYYGGYGNPGILASLTVGFSSGGGRGGGPLSAGPGFQRISQGVGGTALGFGTGGAGALLLNGGASVAGAAGNAGLMTIQAFV